MAHETTTDSLESDASIRRMASFAVMTVDWSNQRRSYLDNFLNYALSVVPDSTTATPRSAVRPLIIERFNLFLPANIVEQLIRRAVKLGFLESIGGDSIALTAKGRREVSPIPYTLKKLAQEQVNVAERFVEWAVEQIGVVLDLARATSILLDYVETYYCSLMSLSEKGASLKLPLTEPSPEQKVAAAFVYAMNESDGETFDSIANMARGSMMVSALYAPALVDTTRGFRHTTIYIDTKLVLRALGYEGDAAEQSTIELIDLLKRQGARVAIFDFTLREIQSVLDAVAQKARGGRIWDSRPGSVESYFYRSNASNAQIEQHSVRVEGRVLGLGMHVDPSPSYENHRFVIDESEIEAALRAGNPNYRATALQHDVTLIASVVRARAGRSRNTLEESRATFMTLNSLVVRTARAAQFAYKEEWPLVMFESDIAALTWVKEPLAAPSLPKNLLLATSLGLTNPGRNDWGLYIGEITRLLETDEITDNDLILLRQKYESDRLAFVRAPGSSTSATRQKEIRVSIEGAREAVEDQLTAPIRAEKDAMSQQLTHSRQDAELRRQEADRLLAEVLKSIWRMGTFIRWGLAVVLLMLASAALLVTFVPDAEAFIGTLPLGGVILIGIRTVAVVAGVTGGLWGPIAKLCEGLRARFILLQLRRKSIEPDRAAEVGYSILSHRRQVPANEAVGGEK